MAWFLVRLSVLFGLVLVVAAPLDAQPGGVRSAAADDQPVVLSAVAQADRFGIAHVSYGDAPQAADRYQRAVDGGARWDRWSIYWYNVEKSPGSFSFGAVDEVVAADRARGLQPLVILQGTPGFYAPACAGASEGEVPPPPRTEDKGPYFDYLRGKQLSTAACPNPVTMPPNGLYQPVFVNGAINPNNPWARFVYTVASRYRGQVPAYEIWNEPDFRVFWNGSVADYVQLLRVAYQAIKAADPNATVLVGGMMFWEWTNEKGQEHAWLRAFLDELGRDPARFQHNFYFDGIPWHFYSRPTDLYWRILSARTLLEQRGISGKQMWITETNAPACGEPPLWVSCADQNYKGSASVTEQASYVLQAFAYSFAAGVNRTFMFQHYDDGVGESFGMFRNDGSARPAYVAYQLAAEYLANFNSVRREGSGNVERIAFYDYGRGRRVTVIFNRAPSLEWVSIPTQASSGTLIQQDGQRQTIGASGGAFSVAAPPATNNKNFNNDPNDYIIGGWTQILVDAIPQYQHRLFIPLLGRNGPGF